MWDDDAGAKAGEIVIPNMLRLLHVELAIAIEQRSINSRFFVSILSSGLRESKDWAFSVAMFSNWALRSLCRPIGRFLKAWRRPMS